MRYPAPVVGQIIIMPGPVHDMELIVTKVNRSTFDAGVNGRNARRFTLADWTEVGYRSRGETVPTPSRRLL